MSTSSTSRSRGSTFSSNVKTVALRPKFEPPGLIKIQDECSIVVLNSKCGFMSWYILEMCHRATQIIPGLIRSKNKFEERNKQLELLARLRATDGIYAFKRIHANWRYLALEAKDKDSGWGRVFDSGLQAIPYGDKRFPGDCSLLWSRYG
ncbi:hypothetical protein R6Q57_011657 [Mikania cordata]